MFYFNRLRLFGSVLVVLSAVKARSALRIGVKPAAKGQLGRALVLAGSIDGFPGDQGGRGFAVLGRGGLRRMGLVGEILETKGGWCAGRSGNGLGLHDDPLKQSSLATAPGCYVPGSPLDLENEKTRAGA